MSAAFCADGVMAFTDIFLAGRERSSGKTSFRWVVDKVVSASAFVVSIEGNEGFQSSHAREGS